MHRVSRLLVCALLAGAALPARAEVFDAETFTLDNGLQVVVVTNRLAPVVTNMIWYRVGAADDPVGHSGLAHYLEHLMFLGTEAHPEGDLLEIVARNGGQQNAFTSWDYTAYHQSIAVDRLPLMLELEADRMRDLSVDDARALVERDVVMQERLERIDNDPAGRLGEQMMAALYQNYPYGTPIIGWEQEVAELDPAVARDVLDRWYVPNNAIVVVAGDIDAETLRPLVEATYGTIPAGPDPQRHRVSEPPQFAPRLVALSHRDVQQDEWLRYYLAPGYITSDDAVTPYALQVLNDLFGGSLTSRLYRNLVVEQEVAVGAGSFYSAGTVGPSQFGLYATPRDGVSLEDLGQAMDAEIQRLLTEGVTEEEVAAARDRLQIDAIYARDSVGGAARMVGAALAIGMSLDEVQAWPDRIAAVTVDDVMAAARQVLDANQSVTGWLQRDGDAPHLASGGSAPVIPGVIQ
ncbi:MAG: insulinase family protein [Rhodospirillaceae bacterium]|nr:insulinase family protein [Rhodospirillaceae bacterium]